MAALPPFFDRFFGARPNRMAALRAMATDPRPAAPDATWPNATWENGRPAPADAVVIGPVCTVLLSACETHALALYFDAGMRACDVPGVADVDADAAWAKLRDAGLIPAGRRP